MPGVQYRKALPTRVIDIPEPLPETDFADLNNVNAINFDLLFDRSYSSSKPILLTHRRKLLWLLEDRRDGQTGFRAIRAIIRSNNYCPMGNIVRGHNQTSTPNGECQHENALGDRDIQQSETGPERSHNAKE